jgi:hypothetical protein
MRKDPAGPKEHGCGRYENRGRQRRQHRREQHSAIPDLLLRGLPSRKRRDLPGSPARAYNSVIPVHVYNSVIPADDSALLVIPAKAGIQDKAGPRVKPGVTTADCTPPFAGSLNLQTPCLAKFSLPAETAREILGRGLLGSFDPSIRSLIQE